MNTPREVNERGFCLGEDCPDKQCQICWANKTTMLEPTDSYRKSVPNGYYSSGGIIQIKDPQTGKTHYNYARNPIIRD